MNNVFDQRAMVDDGWMVVGATYIGKLIKFREAFERLCKSFLGCPEDIHGTLLNLEPSTLNELTKHLNYKLLSYNHLLVESFELTVISLCGRKIFEQRRPYLRLNIPNKDHTSTPAHSDVYFGHSPYTYTFWIPMHDVVDNSGLYIYNKKTSLDMVRNYNFNESIDKYLQVSNFGLPQDVKVMFGEALVFNCGLFHGAHTNNSSIRISFDTRVQAISKPLFEKNYELFTYREIE